MLIMKQLFANLGILISLLFLYSQASKEPLHPNMKVPKKIWIGLAGGLLSNILMQYSIEIESSIIDLRHIPVILLAFFGGVLPTFIATALVIVGRFIIGFNLSAFASIPFIVLIAIFSIVISKTAWSRRIKIFCMLTFSNLLFFLVIFLLLKDINLLFPLVPIYWVASYLSGFIAFYTLDFIRKSQNLLDQYRLESRTDRLTGLNNVRSFDERFNQTVSESREKKQALSILYLDLDYFKKVNDTYGHAEGDVVLRELGYQLISCTRSFDIVSRNGGEEFTVILLDCPLDRAVEIAENIRKTVEKTPFILNNGKAIKVTISIGVASYQETTADPTLLIEDADRALYQAKKTGRNKVCVVQ